MRLIDSDALKEKAFGKRGGLVHTSDIDDMPTVDAVQVVRCKDCEFWLRDEEHGSNGECECGCNDGWWLPEDYCSCGERRDAKG